MGGELSRHVGLFVLDGPGAGIVFERDEDGEERVPVRIMAGHRAARRWVEGHYDGLEWATRHRARARVGRLAPRPQPLQPTGEQRGRDLRLTYESDDLRAHLPELLAGQRGLVILQQCEEYVPESGRWEPFTTILWESTW